jgi:NADP-dependent 3-hydroxy acid dehydrogenase YdfG
VADEFGRLDVLVNNAGVMLLGPFDTSPDDDWRRMLDLNLNGLLHVTQEAIPHLRASAASGPRGVADLINVGSVAGRIARGGSAVYNAAKFGVTAFSEALRQELAPDGVRVCCVEPGAVATELLTHVDRAVRERMLAGPYRGIQPVAADDIAATIEFIVQLDPAAAINEVLIRPARQGFLPGHPGRLGERIPELGAGHLLGRAARQPVDHPQMMRELEPGQLVLRVPADRLEGDAGSGLGHHDQEPDLAPGRVGHAHHGELNDPGHVEVGRLNLGRVDVLATGPVLVHQPPGDVHESRLVDVAGVADGEPPVIRTALAVAPPVAGRDGRPPHLDLAHSAGR